MKVVPMKRDSDLCDPNFSGYKLSLEGVAIQSSELGAGEGPSHVQPGSSQYSFLHSKLYGEHNHLVADPWGRGDAVYYIGRGGGVIRLEGGQLRELWKGVGSSRKVEGGYNRRLLFVGEREAVVSDGEGQLFIVDTGRRGEGEGTWKTVFCDAVCGRDRPFVVVGGEVGRGSTEMEVVVQYVEERGKVEGVGIPMDGNSGFLNVLEWISFSVSSGGTTHTLAMDRVRRVVTQGGINFVGLVEGKLVLSTEKQATVVFDSMTPMEEVTEQEIQTAANKGPEAGEEKPEFYWRQSSEDVEIWCYGGEGVTRSMVKVGLEGRRVEVVVGGVVLIEGHLWSDVEGDSWTWTLEGGKLGVILCKRVEGQWAAIWGAEGGTRGEEVTDLSEDTFMAHLTTDNPIVGMEEGQGNSFNNEQLEDCDNCENMDMLVWLGGEERMVANLSGHQHLFTVMVVDRAHPAICTRHDVDGAVWKVGGDAVEHVATFPALGYVQASKTQRKFMSAPPSCRYSVISDSSRHLYLYRQPESLAAETELRNRKSGQRVEKVARQQVVTLDTSSDILGLVAREMVVQVLTQDKVHTIQIL